MTPHTLRKLRESGHHISARDILQARTDRRVKELRRKGLGYLEAACWNHYRRELEKLGG